MFRPDSHVDQVAAHLRDLLQQGRWIERMPGALKLEHEIGASHTIIDRALRQLEKEGVLENQGPGRRRRIVTRSAHTAKLKVRVLGYDDVLSPDLNQLISQLQLAGHEASLASKTLRELDMDPGKVKRFVHSNTAHAWVVVAGSRSLLEWFAGQAVPAFGLYGRSKGVDIATAGPRKLPAIGQLVKRLTELGHRRVVAILRREHRESPLGPVAQCILDQLNCLDIPTGDYNLPDWDETPEDLQRMLGSLFKHTPPTALLVDEPAVFLAVRDHLARKGIHAPQQVSLSCLDQLPAFHWQRPAITHIAWDLNRLISHVVRWTNQVAKGKNLRRLKLVDSELVDGETIGPAPI